jgi:hypothetical protein
MSQVDELRESIDARIVQANNEIATLQAARAALTDERAGLSTSAVSANVPRPSRRGRPRNSASHGASAQSSTGPGDGADPGSETASNKRAALTVTTTKAPPSRRAQTRKPASNGAGAESPTGAGDGAVRDARAETPSTRTAAAKPRRTARRTSASPRRSVEVLLAGKLEAMLGGSEGGLSAVTVSKRANASYRQVLTLLRELEQAGRVRRSGTSRASRWRPVTDEERIAERAAELERLSAGTSAT